MKYGTCKTWAEYFERQEGVSIGLPTIYCKLKEAGKIGKSGRNKLNRILKDAFYSEADIREACFGLLQVLPRVGENGFFELDGELYASTDTWSKYFKGTKENVTISPVTITKKLKQADITGITAKRSTGRIYEDAYFSKSDVLEACKDLLQQHLQTDENGFFELNGETYASAETWPKYFKDVEGIAIGAVTITRRLKAAGITGITAKSSKGIIHRNSYFSKSDVFKACGDLLVELPQADENGFLELNGELYASANTWSKYFRDIEEVVISDAIIRKKLRKAGITGITAKSFVGRICTNAYFPKSAILEICKDLLIKLPRTNKDGFFELNEETYASAETWSKYFKNTVKITVSAAGIRYRLKKAGLTGITAKTSVGVIWENAYFPESAVRQACADLLTNSPSRAKSRGKK